MSENQNAEQKNLIRYELTNNVLEKNKFHGIEKQNLAEAIIVPFTVFVIIMCIPFTDIVKGMSLVVLMPVLFGIFIKGYKHRSIFQFIKDEIKFKKRRRVLYLRGVEYKRKKGTEFKDYEEYGFIKSLAEKCKQKLTDFIEKYSTDDTGKNS